jgi:outer membrane lipase/esterase
MKKIPLLLTAAFAAVALGSASQAQNRTFTNQYSFGDSLSDNGNAAALSGGAANAGPPIYVGGRWSNGPVFTERLGNTLALGGVAPVTVKSSMGFAFGGAAAVPATSVVPFPSLPLQLQLFQSHAVSIQRTDLFTVWFGANDVLNTMAAPTTPANPAAMDAAGINAAQATVGMVQSLINLGAKNIVTLNLPDIGRTSAVAPSAGAAFGTRGSLAYNAEFDARLRNVAATATDVNIVRIDVRGIFDKLLTDYAAAGYTGLVLPASAASQGDAAPYVFFVDGLHPSARTHMLLASVITEALNPEPVIGSVATLGTAALTLQGLAASALDARTAQLGSSTRKAGRGDVYASFNYGDGNRDAAGLRSKFNYTAQVMTAGADFRVSDGVILGGAFNVGRLNAKLGAGGGNFTVEQNTGRLYAVWQGGPVSLAADGDFGTVRVKGIHRTTAFAGLQTNSKTDGTHWGAGLKAMWALDAGGFSARPWLGLRTERVKLDAYAEKDVPTLSMDLDAQEAKSSTGGLGIDLGTDTKVANRTLHIDFSAAWHGELSTRTRNVSGKLANNFTRTTTVGVRDGDGRGVALGAAATLAVAKNCGVTLGYAADLRSDDKLANRISLSVQTGF